MPDLYARVGEIVVKSLSEKIGAISILDVPHIGRCSVTIDEPPALLFGNWGFNVKVDFPQKNDHVLIGVVTIGSGLGSEIEEGNLPPPTFEDPLEKEFPPAHQAAWYELLDAIEELFLASGFLHGNDQSADFWLNQDYMPSRGITGAIFKPQVVTPDFVQKCAVFLKMHSEWEFWLQFDLAFDPAHYRGVDERLLLRSDRLMTDMNFQRLKSEFGIDLSWLRTFEVS